MPARTWVAVAALAVGVAVVLPLAACGSLVGVLNVIDAVACDSDDSDSLFCDSDDSDALFDFDDSDSDALDDLFDF